MKNQFKFIKMLLIVGMFFQTEVLLSMLAKTTQQVTPIVVSAALPSLSSMTNQLINDVSARLESDGQGSNQKLASVFDYNSQFQNTYSQSSIPLHNITVPRLLAADQQRLPSFAHSDQFSLPVTVSSTGRVPDYAAIRADATFMSTKKFKDHYGGGSISSRISNNPFGFKANARYNDLFRIKNQSRLFSTSKSDDMNLDAIPSYGEIIEFIENNFSHFFDRDVNISKIAWPLQGFSYQAIIDIVQGNIDNNPSKISQNSWYNVLQSMLHGPKKPQTISLPNNQGVLLMPQRKEVAYHEAGHLVAELYNPTGHIITMATAEEHRDLEGSVTRVNLDGEQLIEKHIINSMIMFLAGSVTEQVFGIDQSSEMIIDEDKLYNFFMNNVAGGDFKRFQSLIMILVKKNKLNDRERDDLCIRIYRDTYEFILQHKAEIKKFADLLIEKGTLYEDEIYDIVNKSKPLYKFEHGPLPKEYADQYFYRKQS